MQRTERFEAIVPTVDLANGDMIVVLRTEDSSGGRSFRMSPELGAEFRSYFFRDDPPEGELIKPANLQDWPAADGGGLSLSCGRKVTQLEYAELQPARAYCPAK
ncbi:hypothetical protein [Mesorhizobium sp. M0496]